MKRTQRDGLLVSKVEFVKFQISTIDSEIFVSSVLAMELSMKIMRIIK